MESLTYERFEKAIEEVLDTDLLIASHAVAGVGSKRVSYNPSLGCYHIFIKKNGKTLVDSNTAVRRNAFDKFQSVDLERG